MIEHASWSSFWAMRTSQLCFPNSDWVQPLRSDEIIMIIWLSFVTNTHDRSERTLMINCHRGASRPSPTSHLTHAPEREKEREIERKRERERMRLWKRERARQRQRPGQREIHICDLTHNCFRSNTCTLCICHVPGLILVCHSSIQKKRQNDSYMWKSWGL